MSTQFTNRQWRLPNNENKDKQSNYSMDFDAASLDYIDCGDDDIFSFGNNSNDSPFSVSFFVNLNSYPSTNIVFVSKDDGSPNREYAIGMFSGNRYVRFFIKNQGGNNQQSVDSTTTIALGSWYHVLATYDGRGGSNAADGMNLYINSINETTSPVKQSYTAMSNTTAPFRIGQYNSSAYVDGKIDAVAIYNYALSSSQVTTLYGSSSTGIGNPMSLSPKPVAYYPLGDQDAFNGASYLTPNASLKDFVFNFSGSSVSTSSTYSELDTANKLTISFWVKSTSAVTSVPLSIGTSPNRQIFVIIQSSNRIVFRKNENGDNTYLRADSGTPHDGNWNHILISMDLTASPRGGIYFNGNNITYQNTLDTNAIQTSTGSLLVGDSANFVGNIAELAIWSGTDLRNDVATIYNNGSPNDLNNNGLTAPTTWYKLNASDTYDGTNWTIEDHAGSNDGTSSGMTQANLVQSDLSFTSGFSPFALEFDGANDYIDLGNLTGVEANQFSISMWAKITATNRILFNSGLVHPNGILIQYVGTYFFISVGGSGTASSTITLNTTKWYNILLSVNGTTLKFYIDGSQLGSDLTIGSGRTGIGSDAVLARYKYSTTHYVKGSISNLSIWNTALTSSQVTELYNEGVPSNLNNHSAYSNLVNWWQLGSNSSFNTNWTVLDEKGSNNGTSVNMTEADIVDGVGSYANGTSSGMGGDEVIGSAPFSDANSLSINMDVLDRTEDTPS